MYKTLVKLYVVVFLLLTGFLSANAQSKLKFSIVSFGLDQFDMTARNDSYKKMDGNGSLYAIIKVTSISPDDVLTAYNFNFGNMNSLVEQHDDELWVYVQRNAKMVTISREGYATISRYDLQTTIEEGRTYTMQLSSQGPVVRMQMVLFQIIPANSKAVVMVKGSQTGAAEELLGTADDNGQLAKNMLLDTYTYRVLGENYYPSEGRITLNNQHQTHQETITLRPRFSTITLNVADDAEIYVNGERKGVRSWQGPLNAGTYHVECRKQNHRPTTQSITVEENHPESFNLQAPTPITGILAVISHPLGASIKIDGRDYGTTPRNITDLLIGHHTVTLSRQGYTDKQATIEIKEGETTDLNLTLDHTPTPTPIVVQPAQRDPLGLCPDANHPHKIDMGNGIKWSCCNVGAKSPIEYGVYFAWGETKSKTTYNWSTYSLCNGTNTSMTKYCNSSFYGTVDNKTKLDLTDDAARVNWGGTWRMPTIDEYSTLNSSCTWTWTTVGGVNGYKVTAKNDNVLFFPAAGYRNDSSLSRAGSRGYYWSSSLNTSYADLARRLYFDSSVHRTGNRIDRCSGRSVRPVTE